MLFRHLRAADGEAAATSSVDQRPGLVARRVLESRSAGAAAPRLRLLAGPGDGIHLGADRFGLAGFAGENRLDDDRPFGQFAMTISIAQLVERPFLDVT